MKHIYSDEKRPNLTPFHYRNQFRENVKADYLTHTLLSDMLSYSNSNAKLIATGNVQGESIEKGEFRADNVEYNLVDKTINFSMFGGKQVNVKIKN